VDAFKGAAGPITAMFGIKEASLINTMNQIFNTAYYGLLALAGGLFCAWGLYEVGKDAGINVGSPLSSAAGVASTLMPEFRGAKAVASKVGRTGSAVKSTGFATSGQGPKMPKVVKSAVKSEPKAAPKKAEPKAAPKKDAGGREQAARDAGLGAAQILRGRREDAAAAK
jgi:hypothetical protein